MTGIEKNGKLDEKNVREILALTPMQQGMLYHYLKDPGSDLYFEQLCLELTGEINRKCFEKAWNFVVETNEMLRALFRWEKLEKPVQIILKKHQLQPIYYDLSDTNITEIKKKLQEITVEDKKKKFPLQEIPFRVTLCEIREDNYMMIISNHHILYDGWSNGILLEEFFNAYSDLYNGKKIVKPVKTRFKEFVKWVHQQGTDMGKQEKFWIDYLKGLDTSKQLSIKKTKEGKISGIRNVRIHLAKDMKIRLERFSKDYKITLASLLYCAWGLLLQKYNNSDDVIWGTTISGRSARIPGIEKMVGLFINTLPMRLTTHPHEIVENLLARTYHSLQTRKEYETTSLVKINEFNQFNDREVLFDTLVVIENYPLHLSVLRENRILSLNSYSMVEMTNYHLTIGIWISAGIEMNFVYHREVFNHDDIERMANHFRRLTENIIAFPGRRPSEIEIMSPEEKRTVLHTFNATAADYPKDKTLPWLFEEQVQRTPDQVALLGGHQKNHNMSYMSYMSHMSYKELNEKSNQLAALLREKDVQPDTAVGLMTERSVEMIIGILGILKAGTAYLPIDPDYPEERIQYMLKDSNAKILVTVPGLTEKLLIVNCQLLMVNEKPPYRRSLNTPPQETNLAYIIYTSGSTGKPHGVMVTHQNVVNLSEALKNIVYNYLEPVNTALVSPYVFDASIKQIFPVLLAGHRLLIVPQDTRLDGEKLVNYFKEKDVRISDGTPIHLSILMNFKSELGHPFPVKKFVIGGEALERELSQQLLDIINTDECEIINVYGPTECCDVSSSYTVTGETLNRIHRIPIGKPLNNVKLYILGRNREVQPIGIPGELYIAGAGIARGYLNNPELTAEKFDHKPNAMHHAPCAILSPHRPIYRTGDLGRWLKDGNIDFLGRIDHQVKIRGYRIELGEIEHRLRTYREIKEAVVVARSDETRDQSLCAYIVSNREPEISELQEYLAKSLPDYMIPSLFMQVEKIPLTPNGKVDRKSLPEPILKPGAEYVPPGNEVEEKLAEIWANVLELDKEIISVHDNFFRLGGHSLKATALMAKIHKEFNIQITLAEIFKTPYIRSIASYIKDAAKDTYLSLEACEKKEYYRLSSAQKRLYVMQQIDPESTLYNMTTQLTLEVDIDKERLENSLKKLITRHESLRTSFHIIEEEQVQKVHRKVHFEIEYYKSGKEGTGELAPLPQRTASNIKHFVRPFDLLKPPLVRVGLVNTGEKQHLLMADMHHIISDETSSEILIRELVNVYLGVAEKLPELRLQYKDFSQWQNKRIILAEMKKQEAYWLNRFKRKPSRIKIPADYPRPAMRTYEGNALDFEIPRNQAEQLRELAKKENATMFIVGLAICNILLHKITNQEDVVLGTLTAGRKHADLQNIIGFFINTLALRNHPKADQPFIHFLREVRNNTLDAFDNQDYQFDALVENVSVAREPGRNPLFDALFTFVSLNIKKPPPIEKPAESIKTDLRLKAYGSNKGTQSKFDLIFYGQDTGDTLSFVVTYAVEIFKKITVEKFIEYFKEIVSVVEKNENIRLKDIKVSHDLGIAASKVYKSNKITFDF